VHLSKRNNGEVLMNTVPEAARGDQLTLLDSEPGKFAFYLWQNVVIEHLKRTGVQLASQELLDILEATRREQISTSTTKSN
jgi:hypothetical protein